MGSISSAASILSQFPLGAQFGPFQAELQTSRPHQGLPLHLEPDAPIRFRLAYLLCSLTSRECEPRPKIGRALFYLLSGRGMPQIVQMDPAYAVLWQEHLHRQYTSCTQTILVKQPTASFHRMIVAI